MTFENIGLRSSQNPSLISLYYNLAAVDLKYHAKMRRIMKKKIVCTRKYFFKTILKNRFEVFSEILSNISVPNFEVVGLFVWAWAPTQTNLERATQYFIYALKYISHEKNVNNICDNMLKIGTIIKYFIK